MVTQVSSASTRPGRLLQAIAPDGAIQPPPPPAASPLAGPLPHGQRPGSPADYNYSAHITGAVLFDNNGLPQEYFTTAQISLDNWEQLIFQLLGLRWLLMSSLQFDSFSFAQASSDRHTAVLLRQRETYIALLTENLQGKIHEPAFRQWLSGFELSELRRNRRFQSF